MNRQFTLAQKIKNYGVFAGSMLATAITTEAQVIYTDVNPDDVLGGAVPTAYPDLDRDSIDLNNDGVFDFRISLNISNTNPDATGFDFYEKVDAIFDPLHNAIWTYSLGYAPIASQLNCDDSVPQFLPFHGFSSAIFSFQFGASQANNWVNVQDRYLGLQFNIGGQTHYGWLRLDVNTMDTIPNIVVKDYAYEATPGKPIAVCDTGFGLTGIHKLVNAQDAMTVFPNPSHGDCIVRIDDAIEGTVKISVNDVSGKEVYSTFLQTNGQLRDLPLNLSQLSPGLYFIHLKSETNSAAVKWTKL